MSQADCEDVLFSSFPDGMALQASCMLFGQLIASRASYGTTPLAVLTQSQPTFLADCACSSPYS